MIKRIKYHLGFLSLVKLGGEYYYVTYTHWGDRYFVYQYNGKTETTRF